VNTASIWDTPVPCAFATVATEFIPFVETIGRPFTVPVTDVDASRQVEFVVVPNVKFSDVTADPVKYPDRYPMHPAITQAVGVVPRSTVTVSPEVAEDVEVRTVYGMS
jgi:hypothetical protein